MMILLKWCVILTIERERVCVCVTVTHYIRLYDPSTCTEDTSIKRTSLLVPMVFVIEGFHYNDYSLSLYKLIELYLHILLYVRRVIITV